MDGLAREPEKLITPHNPDTGETILHLLAKEGKTEILRNLLDDPRVEKDLVKSLLKQDKLGWNPIMTAIKADSGGEEMVEMFLTFLENNLEHSDLVTLLTSQNIAKVKSTFNAQLFRAYRITLCPNVCRTRFLLCLWEILLVLMLQCALQKTFQTQIQDGCCLACWPKAQLVTRSTDGWWRWSSSYWHPTHVIWRQDRPEKS